MAETNYERILGISKSIMTVYLRLIESEKTGDTEEYQKYLEYLRNAGVPISISVCIRKTMCLRKATRQIFG